MNRVPELEREELTEAQAEIYDRILASRGSIAGPFRIWLHSPELADRAQRLGEFVRYRTALEPRLSELAILLAGRHMNCQVEWSIHERFAREAGLKSHIIDAIRNRQEPAFEQPDERTVYAFVVELLKGRFVQDTAFEAALDLLGKQAVVELTALVGYYTLVAMTLNTFQVPLPGGTRPLLTDCPTFT